MQAATGEGVVAPPLRVGKEKVSAARATKPDEPVSRNRSKNRPSEAHDECGGGCSEKPDGHLYEQEHEWHKSKESEEAQIPPSAILPPRVRFRHSFSV